MWTHQQIGVVTIHNDLQETLLSVSILIDCRDVGMQRCWYAPKI